LIAFVQAEYAEDNEEGEVDLAFAHELHRTQWHAFRALRRRRQGHGDAKRLQLDITAGEPLAACLHCGVIVPDNRSVAGKSLVRKWCGRHDRPSRRLVG